MADSATDIDLDSVIDRLLEGGWRVPVSVVFRELPPSGGGHPNAFGALLAGWVEGFRGWV